MKQTPESLREQISALVDDRLDDEECAQMVGRLGADVALQSTWRTYHLVGDVLRAGRPSACSDGAAFLTRFQQRLAAEPQVSRPAIPVATARPAVKQQPLEAANEPVFRWKLIAGAASLAAAAAIGWNWVGSGLSAPPAGAQMAQQVQPSPASADAGDSVLAAVQGEASGSGAQGPTRVVVGSDSGRAQVMLRDPRLDQLLEAHRQAAGGAQMPSGFLRNATFEGSAR